jgi:esterase/lipase superfamily enzyme
LRDAETAVWTAPHLRDLIVRLWNRFPSEPLHLLAVGLGCSSVLSALLTISSQKQTSSMRQVIFVRPDIDLALFRESAQQISRIVDRVTLYVSERDKSLDLSRRRHGSPRAGSVVQIIPGVDTIDVSPSDTDLINAGITREILSDIHSVLRAIPPGQRFGLRMISTSEGSYWVAGESPSGDSRAGSSSLSERS